MRLDLLLQRENFPHIFVKLLEKEFSRYFNWLGKVSWKKSDLVSYQRQLLVNHKLNVIYPSSINRQTLRQITAEYSYNPNFILHLLQSLFVRFATSLPFEHFTTIAVVNVTPWLETVEQWCIIPGNHSVRIVEFNQNRCRVIVKPGFNPVFVRNEISIREKFPYLPIPKLIDSDIKYGWYLEERIIALPMNRIADTNICDEMLIKAQDTMLRLYSDTNKKERLSDLREELTINIKQAVECLPRIYSNIEREQLLFVFNKLNNGFIKPEEQLVDTVQSHGDFQSANLLVATEKGDSRLYIIDWEYSERRSQFYDALVFALQVRSPVGLAKRVNLIMNEDNVHELNWCSYFTITEWMLRLFLMEDLLVRVKEMHIPELKQKSTGLMQWMIEVEKIQWLNKR